MKKIPSDDPRAKHQSSDTEVDRAGLIDFVRGKHRFVLSTTRRDGRPQMSLVTGTITDDGELLISTYPSRAKAHNVRRHPHCSVLVLGEQFDDAWVQIDGDGVIDDVPEAVDGLVEYFRSISGEHSDWDEYRQAMIDQNKSLIRIQPTRWGPVSVGGFPPELFDT